MGMNKMTKIELAESVSKDEEVKANGTSSREVAAIISKFIDKLRDSIEELGSGERIELRGFGTFGVKQRKARIARNPQTGVEVKVPARKSPFFKPGRDMKLAIQK